MALLTEENNLIKKLPEHLQPYVVARYTKPIIQCTDYELQATCLTSVQDAVNANERLGKDNSAVITNLYEQLAKDLRKPKFRAITLEEVTEALFRGARKEYGDFFAVNIGTIHGWIDAYLKSKERLEAINQFILLSNEGLTTDKPRMLTVQEDIEGCKKLFERYRNSGNLDQLAFAYYDFINERVGVLVDSRKTLVPDPKVRQDILEKTEGALLESLLDERKRLEKRGFMGDARSITQKIEMGFKGDKLLKNRQKQMALKWYFDTLIKEGRELEL